MSGTDATPSRIRFARVELRYGRHERAFDLVAGETSASGRRTSNGTVRAGSGRPFVILGPNAAGKTTLMEGVVRTIFGFRRTRREERETFERRRPWSGGAYEGRVVVDTAGGRYTIAREFDSDLVRVTRDGEATPLFESEANPSRAGEAVRRYRDLLAETVGLSELEAYGRTACVFQGGLLGTDLSVDLLRVAAGGHADVETAQRSIVREYRELTVEPIAPGASRRRKPGLLEQLDESIGELSARAAEARAAEERRAPLVHARDDLRRRLAALDTEVMAFETAFETLSEAERLESEVEAGRAIVRALESASRDLDEALARFELLADQERLRSASPVYPFDFRERARVLEDGLWPRTRAIETELASLSSVQEPGALGRWAPAPVTLGAGGAAVAGGIALIALGSTGAGIALVLAGAAVVAVAGSSRHAARLRAGYRERRTRELSEERVEIAARIGELLEGVPDAASVSPDTVASHRREFEREEAGRQLFSEAEATLRSSLDGARRSLEQTRAADSGPDDADVDHPGSDHPGSDHPGSDRPGAGDGRPRDRDPGRSAAAGSARGPTPTPRLPERTRELLRCLHDHASAERDGRVAPAMLRLGEISRIRFDLPDDVARTAEGVRLGRRERLAAAAAARADLARVERDLAVGTPGESAWALERERDARRERLSAVEARAAAYREAYALVARAYEEFRQTDEERLVAAISGHLERLSGGTLGPLEAADGLDGARVRSAGRSFEMETPPLSYGQLHTALFAVRLGAADFLAGLGVGVPLLIDDPFVHLDERSAADLWGVLVGVSRERQVVIATQDRLVLAHLGVTPDLELDHHEAGDRADGAGRSRGAVPDEHGGVREEDGSPGQDEVRSPGQDGAAEGDRLAEGDGLPEGDGVPDEEDVPDPEQVTGRSPVLDLWGQTDG